MKIFIDADACPVTDIAIAIGKKHNIPITIICDTAHEISREGCDTVIADKGADSADLILANKIKKGDIAVTQDYGLAALCLAKNAKAINQNGLIFTNENIEKLLYTRFVSKKIRQSGGRTKGPPKRKKEDDDAFSQAFEKLIIISVKEQNNE